MKKKIKIWLKDKWLWLLSFNNPVIVNITSESGHIRLKKNCPFIEVKGSRYIINVDWGKMDIDYNTDTIHAINSGTWDDPNNWQRPNQPTMTFDLCTGYQKSNCCTGFISEEEPYCHTCKEHAQNECVECPYDKCPKRKEIK